MKSVREVGCMKSRRGMFYEEWERDRLYKKWERYVLRRDL